MTDDELVHLFKTGNNPNYAFNLIIKKHQERLYWMINRIVQNHDDTDDVLQNVFIKAWKALPKFREDASLYTWLYRIATNESFTFVKKNRKFDFPTPKIKHSNMKKKTFNRTRHKSFRQVNTH